jgi:cobalamin biosynthesis protein CobT
MSGNPDGENILWAYDRLAKRKERKKLLIVMSDGSPAASKGGYGITKYTEEVIREIEASKDIEIYGLGLCCDSVKHFYKSNSERINFYRWFVFQ